MAFCFDLNNKGSYFAAIVPNSRLIVTTSSWPSVEAYATPYVMGRSERAVRGLGTAPLITRPRITDTTGSDALITEKKK